MASVGKRSGKLDRPRARKAAKMVAEGKPVYEAMRAVGYAASTANDHPEMMLKNPIFQEAQKEIQPLIAAAAEKYGLTIDRLVKKAADGLEAMKPMSGVGGLVLKLKGNEPTEMGHGNAMIPDNDAQVKWWDRCAQLLGIKKDDEAPTMNVFNIQTIVQMIRQSEAERGLADVSRE